MACCVAVNRIHLPDIHQDESSCGSAASAPERGTLSEDAPVTLPKTRARAKSVEIAAEATRPFKYSGATRCFKNFRKPYSLLSRSSKLMSPKTEPYVSEVQKLGTAIMNKNQLSSKVDAPSCKDNVDIKSKKKDDLSQACQESELQEDHSGAEETLPDGDDTKYSDHKTKTTAKKRTKRASSVEWDCSGSESSHHSVAPQKKNKTISKTRKRTSSIGSEWDQNEMSVVNRGEDNLNSVGSQASTGKFLKCCKCDAKFHKPEHLSVHLAKHDGLIARPFTCDFGGCGKAYSLRHHLTRHKSVAHPELTDCVKTIVKCNELKEGPVESEKSVPAEENEKCSEDKLTNTSKRTSKRASSVELVWSEKTIEKCNELKESPVESEKTEPAEENTKCSGNKLTNTSKRTRKRASSVEWDWSGCESSKPSEVPQQKNKNKNISKTRKRTPSIDSDWVPSVVDLSSDEDELESFLNKGSFKTCYVCDKEFKKPSLLRAHLALHIPTLRTYACDVDGCSRSYSMKHHLVRHKSTSHSDLKVVQSIKCPDEKCGRLFTSGCGLKKHFNKYHAGKSLKFPCPQCDKQFTKNKQLTYHLAEHAQKPPLKCSECETYAYTDIELKRHMRIHKEYPCDIPGCKQIFFNFTSFRKHLSEHTRCFQTLRCAHCDKVFTTKFNLRNHVLTHLEKRQIFICPYPPCPRFYYQKRNLNSHVNLRHEKKSNFACSWPDCDFMFTTQKHLDRHINVHKSGKKEPVQKLGPKRRRKDAGVPKRSMAAKLTGVKVPPSIEKDLIKANERPDSSEQKAEEDTGQSYQWLQRVRKVPPSSREQSNLLAEESVSPTALTVVQHDSAILLDTTPRVFEETSNCVGKIFEVDSSGVLVEVGGIELNDCSETSEQVGEAKLDETPAEVTLRTPNARLQNKIGQKTTIPDQNVTQSVKKTVVVENEDCVLNNVVETRATQNTKLKNNDVSEVCQAPVCHEVESDGELLKAKRSSCANEIPSKGKSGHAVTFTESQALNLLEANPLCAKLCAETVVEGLSSNVDNEVLLVIPKEGQLQFTNNICRDSKDVSTEQVLEALSGNFEIFKVADKSSGSKPYGSSSRLSSDATFQKVSKNEPSVSCILQPLLQNLSHEPSCSKKHGSLGVSSLGSEICESKDSNPLSKESVIITKLAHLFRNPFAFFQRKGSFKQNLQGPIQNHAESDISSISGTDDSQSDDSGSEDNNLSDYNDEGGIDSDNASDDGHDGDGEDEDDEEENDDVEIDDEEVEEDSDEEDDDENGNNHAAQQLNGDNNNNDNADNCDGDNAERQLESDSNSNHSNHGDGSDFGVDRALSPKKELSVSGEGQSPKKELLSNSGENDLILGEKILSPLKHVDVISPNNASVHGMQTASIEVQTIKEEVENFDCSLGPAISPPDQEPVRRVRRSARLSRAEPSKVLQKRTAAAQVDAMTKGLKQARETTNKKRVTDRTIDSSDSEPIVTKKRRIYNIGDDSNDSSSEKPGNSDPKNTEESQNLSFQNENSKTSIKTAKVCSKLPTDVWISVLRQVSKRFRSES